MCSCHGFLDFRSTGFSLSYLQTGLRTTYLIPLIFLWFPVSLLPFAERSSLSVVKNHNHFFTVIQPFFMNSYNFLQLNLGEACLKVSVDSSTVLLMLQLALYQLGLLVTDLDIWKFLWILCKAYVVARSLFVQLYGYQSYKVQTFVVDQRSFC